MYIFYSLLKSIDLVNEMFKTGNALLLIQIKRNGIVIVYAFDL